MSTVDPHVSVEAMCCATSVGHVPMLADPTFADMVQQIGEASLGADEKQIWHLTKVNPGQRCCVACSSYHAADYPGHGPRTTCRYCPHKTVRDHQVCAASVVHICQIHHVAVDCHKMS